MSAAMIEKLIWSAFAVALYLVTVWPPASAIAEPLKVLAGLVIGKAWLQSVDEKHAARARSTIPPGTTIGILFLLALLPGCANPPPVDYERVQLNADSMTRVVNGVVEDAKQLAPLVQVACALRGQDSQTCAVMQAAYTVVRGAAATAHRAIAVYRIGGLGLERTQRTLAELEGALEVLKATAAASAEEVRDAAHRVAPGVADVDAGPPAREAEGASLLPYAPGSTGPPANTTAAPGAGTQAPAARPQAPAADR